MHGFRRSLGLTLLALMALGASTMVAHAQGRVQGKFTDKWGNPIVGAEVFVEPGEGTTGARQDSTTDEDGEYRFMGLANGRWEVEVHANGYQPIRTAANVRQTAPNTPIEIELDVLPSGGRFRGDTQFEAEGGTPSITFTEDGEFELEDADGTAAGTYGIVDLNAVLVVRDYDGPDDKYSMSEPVVIVAPNDQFLSVTWGESTLRKR